MRGYKLMKGVFFIGELKRPNFSMITHFVEILNMDDLRIFLPEERA